MIQIKKAKKIQKKSRKKISGKFAILEAFKSFERCSFQHFAIVGMRDFN